MSQRNFRLLHVEDTISSHTTCDTTVAIQYFTNSNRSSTVRGSVNYRWKARSILIGLLWLSAKAALVWNYLEVYWPGAGGLSAVNAIGTQLRDPINSGTDPMAYGGLK